MAEKVIHEVRITETDDGYRIEIKGDKERLKEMGFGRGFPFPGMFGMGGHGPFGRHHHGPFGHGFPFGRRHGPPWWHEEEDDEPKEKTEGKV